MPPQRGPRWSNPLSPLQAARFQRHWSGAEVCEQIRKLCPGHGGRPCQIRQTKLSDWETARPDERGQPRRPGLAHLQVLCAIYQASPEDLGLITWRSPHEREQAETAARERLRAEIRAELEAERNAQAAGGAVAEPEAVALGGDGMPDEEVFAGRLWWA